MATFTKLEPGGWRVQLLRKRQRAAKAILDVMARHISDPEQRSLAVT